MRFQLNVILLKAVFQVHKQVVSTEETLLRDHVATAEVTLRNELKQDLQWKENQVSAFIVALFA